MKRRILSLLLITAMGISFLVGCGGNDNDNSKEPSKGTESNVNQDTEKR